MKTFTEGIFILLVVSFGAANVSADSSAGLITEISETVWIHRNEDRLQAETGENLLSGDTLVLPEGSRLSLLTFPACEEWDLTGPDTIRVDPEGLSDPEAKSDPRPKTTLDICFDPGSFQSVSHGRLGGITVRSDLVTAQRLKAEKGAASAAELLTVILFDLKRGRPEKALPFFELLKQKLPPGPFVKRLSGLIQESHE